jgi:uncharacterized membrane protein
MSLVMIRLIHVLLGIFWGGTVIFVTIYLMPSIRAAGPAGGKVMAQLMKRGYLGAITLVGLFTVLTGVYVLWSVSSGFHSDFMGSVRGIVLSTGGLTGFLALGVLAHMSRPTARKLGVVAQRMSAGEGPPSEEDVAEMARLQGKLGLALTITFVLMVITLVTMTFGAHGA